MKWRLILATALLFAGASTVDASESVRPSLDVDEVRVEVHWMDSESDIADVRSEYGAGFRANRVSGFSVLKRNTETGEYVCELYVVRPKRVDDARTLALGHELLHCLAGDYHR